MKPIPDTEWWHPGSPHLASSIPHRRKFGFTLIELLIVIAIIAVLAALLLPVLRDARDSSRSVVCLSNLRQLWVATHLYANDYNGRFPPGWTWAPLDRYQAWPLYIRHYFPGVNGSLESLSLNDFTLNPCPMSMEIRTTWGETWDLFHNRRQPIMNNPFFCPSTDPGEAVEHSCGVTTDYAANCWTGGMGCNSPSAPDDGNCYGFATRRQRIQFPSRMAMYADAYWWGSSVVGYPGSYNNIRSRHGRDTRANVVCVDGHAVSCLWEGGNGSVDISFGSSSQGLGNFKVWFGP